LVILLFIAMIQGILNPKYDLAKEAKIVLDTIAGEHPDLGILSLNELTDERIRNLNNKDYMELKSMLGVKSDFCIFFEDITGNFVQVDGIKAGIGSDKISVNGQPCG
ncbi:MAG: hypothetical protein IIB81_05000, partial [Nanoarchaeota archaeon]|nr:hypothetical protein [Nanoarchaeota archaeon]